MRFHLMPLIDIGTVRMPHFHCRLVTLDHIALSHIKSFCEPDHLIARHTFTTVDDAGTECMTDRLYVNTIVLGKQKHFRCTRPALKAWMFRRTMMFANRAAVRRWNLLYGTVISGGVDGDRCPLVIKRSHAEFACQQIRSLKCSMGYEDIDGTNLLA